MSSPNVIPWGSEITAQEIADILEQLKTAGGQIAASKTNSDVVRNIRIPRHDREFRDLFRAR